MARKARRILWHSAIIFLVALLARPLPTAAGAVLGERTSRAQVSPPRCEDGSSAAEAGIWRTQNSGTTAHLSSVIFVDEQTGWAVGESGTILKTVDSGTTWRTQTSGTTKGLRHPHS